MIFTRWRPQIGQSYSHILDSNLPNVKGSLDKQIGHLKFRQWSKVAQIQKRKYFPLGVWPKYLSDMENEYSILSFGFSRNRKIA